MRDFFKGWRRKLSPSHVNCQSVRRVRLFAVFAIAICTLGSCGLHSSQVPLRQNTDSEAGAIPKSTVDQVARREMHEKNKEFSPLRDLIVKQGGVWSLNNRKVAEVFLHCFDSLGAHSEISVLQYVGDDTECAYWIGLYLTDAGYLRGHKPEPLLALAIWVNASEYLERTAERNKGNVHRLENVMDKKGPLNEVAATLAMRVHCKSLAITLKRRAVEAYTNGAGGPATSQEDQAVFNSIPDSEVD